MQSKSAQLAVREDAALPVVGQPLDYGHSRAIKSHQGRSHLAVREDAVLPVVGQPAVGEEDSPCDAQAAPHRICQPSSIRGN